MLLLSDTIWRELQGGYRVPYDASKVLARMERGESVWEELWNELHHQGDVGVASYAAIPQIVRISETQRDRDWNLYALASTIEIERHRKSNPPLPEWLAPSYKAAWEGIVKLALCDLAGELDELTLRINHLPRYSNDGLPPLDFLLGVGMAAAFVTAVAAAIIGFAVGFPLFRYLERRGYRSVQACLAAGLIMALIAAALLTIFHQVAGFLLGGDFIYALFLTGIADHFAARHFGTFRFVIGASRRVVL